MKYKKPKKHPRQKRLLIGNTDRHYNVNYMLKSDIEDKIKVTKLNEAEIESEMDNLIATSKRFPRRNSLDYLIYQSRYKNDTLIKKVMEHAGGVSYYTDSIVPYHVLKDLAKNLDGECVYQLKKKFSVEEIHNINLAFMATRVVIDAPVILPEVNPYDVLFALHDIKTDVDEVQFSFPPLKEEVIQEHHKRFYVKRNDGLYHLKTKYKFSFFKYVQNSLSVWGANIHLVCEDPQDMEALKKLIDKDRKKSAMVRKGEFKNV